MLLLPSEAHILFTNLCVIAGTQLIMVKPKDIFFVTASEHLGITPFTGKFVKTPKKSAIMII